MKRYPHSQPTIALIVLLALILPLIPLSRSASIAPTQASTVPANAPATPDNTYSISGKVTNSDGSPAPGVTVRAYGCDLSKQPILYIHGWGGPDEPENDAVGFARFRQWLTQDGYVEGCNFF